MENSAEPSSLSDHKTCSLTDSARSSRVGTSIDGVGKISSQGHENGNEIVDSGEVFEALSIGSILKIGERRSFNELSKTPETFLRRETQKCADIEEKNSWFFWNCRFVILFFLQSLALTRTFQNHEKHVAKPRRVLTPLGRGQLTKGGNSALATLRFPSFSRTVATLSVLWPPLAPTPYPATTITVTFANYPQILRFSSRFVSLWDTLPRNLPNEWNFFPLLSFLFHSFQSWSS